MLSSPNLPIRFFSEQKEGTKKERKTLISDGNKEGKMWDQKVRA
jgi:hypothetical protein